MVSDLHRASYSLGSPSSRSTTSGSDRFMLLATRRGSGFPMSQRVLIGSYPFAIAIALASAILTGGSKSEKLQARGGEDVSKPVAVEAVRQEPVRRAVEVVATL